MRIRTWMAAAAVLPVAALSVAAAPAGGTDCRTSDINPEAEVCRTRTYLQCDTTVPFYHNYLVEGRMAEFTLDEPAGSFSSGSGCGEYDEPFLGATVQDTPWEWDFGGWVEGNIDAMTFELHNLGFTEERAGGDITLDVRLTVDGASPFGGESNESAAGDVMQSPRTVEVTVTPQASENGVTNVYRFTVTGIGEFLDTLEPGLDNTERRVVVTIAGPMGFNPWVWGASDAATGIVFNPIEGDDLGTVIEATG